jgi:hypothetical protein
VLLVSVTGIIAAFSRCHSTSETFFPFPQSQPLRSNLDLDWKLTDSDNYPVPAPGIPSPCVLGFAEVDQLSLRQMRSAVQICHGMQFENLDWDLKLRLKERSAICLFSSLKLRIHRFSDSARVIGRFYCIIQESSVWRTIYWLNFLDCLFCFSVDCYCAVIGKR